jgi:hypothetical protein
MTRNKYDHGMFIWCWNSERSYLDKETDNNIIGSVTNGPHHLLQQGIKKPFGFTCHEGNILKFLKLWSIQIPSGISLDQTHHITSIIL